MEKANVVLPEVFFKQLKSDYPDLILIRDGSHPNGLACTIKGDHVISDAKALMVQFGDKTIRLAIEEIHQEPDVSYISGTDNLKHITPGLITYFCDGLI